MLITAKGILLRMALDQLHDIGRATQGVRLIRVGDDDRVVAVARVASKREEREANGLDANGPANNARPPSGPDPTETDTAITGGTEDAPEPLEPEDPADEPDDES